MDLFSSDYFVQWAVYLKPIFFWALITVLALDQYKRHLVNDQSDTNDNSEKIAKVTTVQNYNARGILGALLVSAVFTLFSPAMAPTINKFDSAGHIDNAVTLSQEPVKEIELKDIMRKNEKTNEERKRDFDNMVDWRKDK